MFGQHLRSILGGPVPFMENEAGGSMPPFYPQGTPIVPPSRSETPEMSPTPSGLPPMPKMSKGQMILGILGDALAGAAGRGPAFGQMMQQQKQQEREVAQWGLKRKADLEDYEAKQKIEQRYKAPDVAPALRDAQAWALMTPEQRTAYQEMKQAGAGDPDVFVTLPNGQVYAGPKSGLSQALMGGAPAPQKPVGKLTPIPGGPASAPGGFRP